MSNKTKINGVCITNTDSIILKESEIHIIGDLYVTLFPRQAQIQLLSFRHNILLSAEKHLSHTTDI